MSTATTGRPVGDNEFPVLLRMPDLNAPAWMPPPVALASTPLVPPAPANAAAWKAAVETPIPLPVSPVLATTCIDVVVPSSAPVTDSSATPLPATYSPRVERTPRPSPTPQQWTLIRQLATGGVLVGGMALTYIMIMGGSDESSPDHIPVAGSTLEPPTIETPNSSGTPGHDGPVIVRPDVQRSATEIAEVPPPPQFDRDFQSPPSMPTHIEVAELPRRDGAAGVNGQTPPAGRGPASEFHGRIGPDASSVSSAPKYPTTDPSTYLYRPVSSPPTGDAARTARRQDTMAPPQQR